MYVPLNGTATVLEMLRGIIIQSGNDASKAMAEHIAGNEGTFAHMMNQEAKRNRHDKYPVYELNWFTGRRSLF